MKKQKLLSTAVALFAIVVSSGFAQYAGKGPKPGDVYREYSRVMTGDRDWRVTDPNAIHPDAQSYLPNPILTMTIDDLDGAVRAEVVIDLWGGHVGTTDKRFRFNSNSWIDIPELGNPTNNPECFNQQINAIVDIPLSNLVEGVNSFDGTSGGQTCGNFGWGQWGWYGIVVRIYYDESKPHPSGQISSPISGSSFTENPQISVDAQTSVGVEQVDVLAYYDGYDVDGDGIYKDWQGSYRRGKSDTYISLQNHVGSITSSPYQMTWNTTWVPDQEPDSVRLIARIKDINGYWYVTDEVNNLTLQRTQYSVQLYKPVKETVLKNYWVRIGREEKSSDIAIPFETLLTQAVGTKLNVATWNGRGKGSYPYSTKINGVYIPEQYGENYYYSYDQIGFDPAILSNGTDIITFNSDTDGHGIEILWPGPGITIRYDLDMLVPPQITKEPEDVYSIEGMSAAFTLETAGNPDSYQWQKNSIDIPGANQSVLTLNNLDMFDDGARFTCVISNSAGADTSRAAVLHITAALDRVQKNQQVLYTFSEGSGTTISDESGVLPALNLNIASGDVTWTSTGIKINSSAIITSLVAATKLADSLISTKEISIEIWVKPNTLDITNTLRPARIVGMSQDGSNRNFTLGQGVFNLTGDQYDIRLRTSESSENGLPSLSSGSGTAALAFQNVVFTYKAGRSKIFIDGTNLIDDNLTMRGDFSDWNSTYPLLVGNEVTGDRPWLGEIALIAIYNRALSDDEILHNYAFGEENVAPPVISNVQTIGNDTQATISWTTDRPASSRVDYGVTTSYESGFVENGSLVTDHSVNLTGLTPNTLYHYKLTSVDSEGKTAISGDLTFNSSGFSPPNIVSEPVITATENQVYSYQVIAEDPDPGDVFTFALTMAPDWLSINENTGLINGTPENSHVGLSSVTIEVTDTRDQMDSQSYQLTVLNMNDPPVIISTPSPIAIQDQLYEYQVVIEDPDINDTHTYTLESAPTWLFINNTSGLVSGIPSASDIGDHTVIVKVTDSGNSFDQQTYLLSVYDASGPPQMILNDEFNETTLNTAIWTFVNPLGDATVSLSGTTVDLDVPAGRHEVWGTSPADFINTVPRIMQSANDIDFEIEVKFNSGVGSKYQEQGIYISQDDGNLLRLEFYGDGSNTRLFAANITDKVANIEVNTPIAATNTSPMYMRILRQTDQWSLSYSLDGETFTEGITFTRTMIVDSVGVYGGNNGPAHTASIDYFRELSNDAPRITSEPVTEAYEDQAYTYDVEASDPDIGDVLTYTLAAAPDFLNIDSATGVISGTPGNDDVGDHPVTVLVTDKENATAEQNYTLTVININDKPVITSQPVTSATEDQPYSYDVEAIDIDAGDSLTYSLVEAPVFLVIDPITGLISGTPTNDHVGSFTVTLEVTDTQNAIAEQSYTLTVNNVNDAPQIISEPVTETDEDQLYSYDVAASDVDVGDTQTFELVEKPDFLTINSASGLISGIPTNDNIGSYTVTVKVSDVANASDTQSYSLTVNNINDAPVITSDPVTNATEDQPYIYTVIASEIDADDSITFGLTTSPDFLSIDPVTGVISGTPANDDVGSHVVTVQVSDESDAQDTQTFTLTVENVNNIPEIVSDPVLTVNENQSYFYTVQVDDPDDQEVITFSLIEKPDFLEINILTGVINGTPDNGDVGSHTVTVNAKDRENASDQQTYTLTVNNVNDTPYFESAPVTSANQGDPYTYQVVASDSDATDEVSFQLIESPQFLSINSSSGLISGTPANEHVGSHQVIVEIKDLSDATARQEYILIVTNENDPPQITSNASTGATEDQLYQYFVQATDPDPNDVLTFKLTKSPAFLSINSTSGLISGTPGDTDVGAHEVIVRVEDLATASDEQIYTLTVLNVNDAPVITSQPAMETDEDKLYVYQVDVSDPDPDEVITYTLTEKPDFLSIDTETGLISGIPTNADVGSHIISLKVTDSGDASDEQTYTLQVQNINDPPVISSTPVTLAKEDSLYQYQVVASDPDIGDVLEYRLILSPKWLSINASGLLSGIPQNEDVGDTTVVIEVSDVAGSTVQQTYSLMVDNSNDSPVIVSQPELSATEDILYEYQVAAVDPDSGDVLKFTLVLTPAWLSINPATGYMRGVPGNDDVGESQVEIMVSDQSDSSDSQTFTLTVINVNNPPMISSLPALKFDEDDSLQIADSWWYPYVTDPDDEDTDLSYLLESGENVFVERTDSQDYLLKNTENWFGTDSLLFIVKDAEYSDSSMVKIRVLSRNDAPYFVDLPDTLELLEADSTMFIDLSPHIVDVDLPGDSLRWGFTIKQGDIDYKFNPVNQVLELSIKKYFGLVTLAMQVTDDSLAMGNDSLIINIKSTVSEIAKMVSSIIPKQFELQQNYPNPFNPITRIRFGLPKAGNVQLEIFNILGQKITTIVDQRLAAGYHEVTFDAGHLASGMYIYRLVSRDTYLLKKMILIR